MSKPFDSKPSGKTLGGIPTYQVGEIEFVKIPAGSFLMGSKQENPLANKDEFPIHTVDISYDFWMSRFPITNVQYAKFLFQKKQTYLGHPENNWEVKHDYPVVNISHEDGWIFCSDWKCAFLSDDLDLRLPTEAEWEKAARGVDGLEWPWGNEYDPDKCNALGAGRKLFSTPVGSFSPQGDSVYGCADMAGNVAEWCNSIYRPYPCKIDDGREYVESSPEKRVVRGGSFLHSQSSVRCAARGDPRKEEQSADDIGFRVCLLNMDDNLLQI
jgi:formylglycine-generating enzyme required for sulfatase activity